MCNININLHILARRNNCMTYHYVKLHCNYNLIAIILANSNFLKYLANVRKRVNGVSPLRQFIIYGIRSSVHNSLSKSTPRLCLV